MMTIMPRTPPISSNKTNNPTNSTIDSTIFTIAHIFSSCLSIVLRYYDFYHFAGIDAENIHDFHHDFITTRTVVQVRRSGQFECRRLLRAKTLPFVLEDVVARPFLAYVAIFIGNADYLTLVLIIVVDSPIIDPIMPIFSQYRFSNDTLFADFLFNVSSMKNK